MERNARLGNRGLTLIEVLVATVIMLIAFLGMMEGARVSMGFAMRNSTREAGVRVAEDNVAAARGTPVHLLTVGSRTDNVVRKVRLVDVPFAVTRSVTAPNENTRRIQVRVEWAGTGTGPANDCVVLVTMVTTKGMLP